MVSDRQTVRVVTITVIMTIAVISVGGVGSAVVTDSNVTLSDTEPTPGSDITVTATATPDNGSAGFTFTHSFNQSVGSVSVDSVSVDDTIIEQANQDGVTVTIGSDIVTAGEQITIEYTITTEDTDGKAVSITGSVANGDSQDLPERSYTTAASPVTRTISAEEVRPGEQITVTTTIDSVSESVSASSQYNPQFDEATISVTVNNQPADPIIEEATVNGSTTTLGDVGTDATVTITEELTVGDELNVTHNITGEITAEGTTFDTDPKSVTVRDIEPQSPVDEFDQDGNGDIEITELGQAGQAFASGEISITELGEVGAAFAS